MGKVGVVALWDLRKISQKIPQSSKVSTAVLQYRPVWFHKSTKHPSEHPLWLLGLYQSTSTAQQLVGKILPSLMPSPLEQSHNWVLTLLLNALDSSTTKTKI